MLNGLLVHLDGSLHSWLSHYLIAVIPRRYSNEMFHVVRLCRLLIASSFQDRPPGPVTVLRTAYPRRPGPPGLGCPRRYSPSCCPERQPTPRARPRKAGPPPPAT